MAWSMGLLGGAGYTVAGSFDLLQTTTLSNSQQTVSLTNLNSTYGTEYQHLQLRMTLGRAGNDDRASGILQINSGNMTYRHWLAAYGTGVQAISANNGYFTFAGRDSLDRFTGMILDINDAFETTKNTTVTWFSGLAGNSEPFVQLGSSFYNSTAAVDSITLTSGVSFSANSRISLYGLKIG